MKDPFDERGEEDFLSLVRDCRKLRKEFIVGGKGRGGEEVKEEVKEEGGRRSKRRSSRRRGKEEGREGRRGGKEEEEGKKEVLNWKVIGRGKGVRVSHNHRKSAEV